MQFERRYGNTCSAQKSGQVAALFLEQPYFTFVKVGLVSYDILNLIIATICVTIPPTVPVNPIGEPLYVWKHLAGGVRSDDDRK